MHYAQYRIWVLFFSSIVCLNLCTFFSFIEKADPFADNSTAKVSTQVNNQWSTHKYISITLTEFYFLIFIFFGIRNTACIVLILYYRKRMILSVAIHLLYYMHHLDQVPLVTYLVLWHRVQKVPVLHCRQRNASNRLHDQPHQDQLHQLCHQVLTLILLTFQDSVIKWVFIFYYNNVILV